MKILTNVTLVIQELLNGLKGISANPKLIFDPTLGYEESITGLRALRTMMTIQDAKTFPLIAWNRSPIVPEESLGRRKIYPKGVHPDTSDGFRLYKSVFGQFEFRMIYISDNIPDIEAFELLYATASGVNSVKKITTTFPEIGSFDYFLTWEDLADITFNKEGNVYIYIGASAIIRGGFVIFNDDDPGGTLDPYPHIEQIRAKILSYNTRWLNPSDPTYDDQKVVYSDLEIHPWLKSIVRAHSRTPKIPTLTT